MFVQQPSHAFASTQSLASESVAAAQQRLANEFKMLDEGNERYDYLISLGRRLTPLPEKWKTIENHLRDCRGEAWLTGGHRDGLLFLAGSAESDMIAGMLAIAIDIYSGRSPEEVLAHPIDAEALGLGSCLSPHRLSCLQNIVQRVRNLAMLARVQGCA